MDKKTFFHKVSQMRAAQREYFKTRNAAALAKSKLLERQIDEEIKRVKAIMADNAKLHYELVDTGYLKDKEWINCHVIESLDYFFCDTQNLKPENFDAYIKEKGFFVCTIFQLLSLMMWVIYQMMICWSLNFN